MKMRKFLLAAAVLSVFLSETGNSGAFLSDTASVTNEFRIADVDTEIREDFDGLRKEQVNVRNTGDTDAWIRVSLLSYRVNEDGERIGGKAEVPSFLPGKHWMKLDGFYYYTIPVPPGESPKWNLCESMELISHYDDADGGKQSVDLFAEAIQSDPPEAVKSAWKVKISEDSVTEIEGGD